MSDARALARFERAEEERSEVLERMSGSEPEALVRAPAPGKWSALQIGSHLVHAETLSLDSVRRKLPEVASLPAAGLAGRMRFAVLTVVLATGWKVKAPEFVSVPPERDGLAGLRADWDEVREGWRAFLEDYPPEHADRAIYRHPIAGRLNLLQAVGFLRGHLLHHRPQIERALAAARRP